jgi:hypothetical protein
MPKGKEHKRKKHLILRASPHAGKNSKMKSIVVGIQQHIWSLLICRSAFPLLVE